MRIPKASLKKPSPAPRGGPTTGLAAVSFMLVVASAGVGFAACGDEATPNTSSTSSSSSSSSGASTSSGAGGTGGASGGGGAGGNAGIAEPAVFQTPDVNAVCGATPSEPCTKSDMAWVKSEYGTEVKRADGGAVADSGTVYRLVAFSEREGPSNIDVFVTDGAGQPISGVAVAFYFSSAPETSRPDEWYPVKVSTKTGADGRAGFALASSAYLPSCGGGGPHAIWISEPAISQDQSIPSDLADKLGMLGGTNHRHLDILFQKQDKGQPLVDPVKCPLGP